MNDPIQKICDILVRMLKSDPTSSLDLITQQVQEIVKHDNELSSALERDSRMLQINQGTSRGYQVIVESNAIAYIGDQYHIDSKDIVKRLGVILEELSRSQRPVGIPNNIPRSGVKEFVGRERELLELQKQLSSTEHVSISAVTGMGGIGKTELALQYSIIHLKRRSYPGGICWLRARNKEISSEITFFAQSNLGIKIPDNLDEHQRVSFCWQRWPIGDVLVVIDDVTDYKCVEPYLPPSDPRFQVLITTRLQSFASAIQTIAIQELDNENALNFIASLSGDLSISDKSELEELCACVGNLPLGLELIGLSLYQKREYTPRELLRLLKSRKLTIEALTSSEPGMTAKLGIMSALEISWMELDEAEEDIAAVLGMFSVDPIPKKLIHSCLSDICSYEITQTTLDKLVSISILKRISVDTYQVHQIIQEFMRFKLNQRDNFNKSLKTSFCRRFAKIFENGDNYLQMDNLLTISQISEMQAQVPHLEEVVVEWNESLADDEFLLPYSVLEVFYANTLNYKKLYEICSKCLEECQARFGQEHLKTATSLHRLACTYERLSYERDATVLCQKALSIRRRLLGKESMEVAQSTLLLGRLYQLQGDYKESEKAFKESLAIRKKILRIEHLDTAEGMSYLALFYGCQYNLQKAANLHEQSLQIRKNLLGEEHLLVAQSMANLAGMYSVMSSATERQKAERLYNKALDIRRKLLDEDHLDVLKNLENIVRLYEAQGCYEEAEKIQSYVVKKLEGRLVDYNLSDNKRARVSLAISHNNLAGIYTKLGMSKEAESLYEQAFAVLLETPRRDRQSYSSCLQKLVW